MLFVLLTGGVIITEFIIKYWLEIILTTITSGIFYAFRQYGGVKNGMIALLRNEIVRIYEKYTKLGYCPSYMKENIKEMYDNYHRLGGNGMVSTMVDKLYQLPNKIKKENLNERKNSK